MFFFLIVSSRSDRTAVAGVDVAAIAGQHLKGVRASNGGSSRSAVRAAQLFLAETAEALTAEAELPGVLLHRRVLLSASFPFHGLCQNPQERPHRLGR